MPRSRAMSSATFCSTSGTVGSRYASVARQPPRVRRIGRRLQRTDPDAGPRAGATISAASAGMSGNFSLPRSHMPTPALSVAALRLPAVVDHRERAIAAGRRQLDDVPRVGEHRSPRCSCRRPNTSRCCRTRGCAGRRGARHICAAERVDAPRTPIRRRDRRAQTTSHTSSARSPSWTPAPPLRTSAQRLTPSGSTCQKQNARAPVRTP